MKTSRVRDAFTLVEMLMVMVIIAIIASLIVSVAGYANKKAIRSRAEGEIKGLEAACEKYKSDNATYPRQEGITEQPGTYLDARLHGDPSSGDSGKRYKAASLYLYKQLSGDLTAPFDGHSDTGATIYFEFKPQMLGGISSSTGTGTVTHLQDPFGFSYGYSTANARAEEDYRAEAATSGTAKRGLTPYGFNVNVDLWSTAGTTVQPPTDATRLRWVKNW